MRAVKGGKFVRNAYGGSGFSIWDGIRWLLIAALIGYWFWRYSGGSLPA